MKLVNPKMLPQQIKWSQTKFELRRIRNIFDMKKINGLQGVVRSNLIAMSLKMKPKEKWFLVTVDKFVSKFLVVRWWWWWCCCCCCCCNATPFLNRAGQLFLGLWWLAFWSHNREVLRLHPDTVLLSFHIALCSLSVHLEKVCELCVFQSNTLAASMYLT